MTVFNTCVWVVMSDKKYIDHNVNNDWQESAQLFSLDFYNNIYVWN